MQLPIGKSVAVLGLFGLVSATPTGNTEAHDEALATVASSATSTGSYCVSVIQCLNFCDRCGRVKLTTPSSAKS